MYKYEEKNCPHCNKLFECKPGNVMHCQCYGVLLNVQQRAIIEEQYDDCLCSDCLHEFKREGVKE